MHFVYDVLVRNELTGQVVTVRMLAACSQEAQVGALTRVFKSQGWRKIVAAPAELVRSQADEELVLRAAS